MVVPAMVLAAMLAGTVLRSDTPRRDRDIMVLYVGAEDCAPCRVWQRSLGADFRASPEFARLSYREVKARTLFELLNDEVWPAELRIYRARIDRTMAVPMWLVLADGKVVTQSFGASQWEGTVLPTLRVLID